MGYQPRTYRGGMGAERFHSFHVVEGETDLWIGADPASFRSEMVSFAHAKVLELRRELMCWISRDRCFLESFSPVDVPSNAPELIRVMATAGKLANVGPMAAVAGAVAEAVGRALVARFGCVEIVVENGGDLWAQITAPLTVALYAGNSPLSFIIMLE